MRFKKTLFLFAVTLAFASVANGQDKSLGAIKGKVRVETGTPAGVTVVVRRGDTEVTRSTTDKNGDFVVSKLTPGKYGVTFRKPGLSIGSLEDIEVKAGKTRSLGDHLVLTIDEGSIAFLSGSVFNAAGRSVANTKVELSRILEDGSTKKIDSRITTETGSFKFRLSPDAGKYRVSVKPDGAEPVTKDVDIDGAAVYRVALNLPAKPQ
ncbi:MAG TPA: carboxypeptidase-like regulatory domain-containing protein [Pyrinomonadaceae bacterium]|jgi:Carboxypeptidase regulatory-like domain|nr:carboxypeptidase-like regulatory domain-containing protein [Pyrinomonadaceae bacterium]